MIVCGRQIFLHMSIRFRHGTKEILHHKERKMHMNHQGDKGSLVRNGFDRSLRAQIYA